MKKRNVKTFTSLVVCFAFLAGIVLIPTRSSAETITKKIEGTGSKTATSADVDDGPLESAEIPINASTSGSDIIYSISVTYGAMEFSYGYGKTWDPVNHAYAEGVVGWDPSKLDASNNKITVENNSNFPVHVTFSADRDEIAEKFNTVPTVSNAVRGIFSDDNTDFVTGGNVTDLVKNGGAGDTSKSVTLEMNASHSSVTTYVRKDRDVPKNNTTECAKSIFFALSGIPNKTIATKDKVGSIIVSVAPETETVVMPQQP